MHTVLWTYLGWRRFPRELTRFEARRFFSFDASNRRELRVRYTRRLRLGAGLQLGFVRLTGTTYYEHRVAAQSRFVSESFRIATQSSSPNEQAR